MSRIRYASLFTFAVAAVISAVAATARADSAPGDLDPTFGAGGKTMVGVGTIAHDGRAAAILPDGRILVAGSVYTGSPGYSIVLARFLPDGGADTEFGVNGEVSIAIPVSFQANAIAVQVDGKIVVGGSTNNGIYGRNHQFDMALARFLADGTLDTAFGNGGVVITNVFGGEDRANAVSILPDGKILVGGWAATAGWPTQYDFVLARYLTDGRLDSSFGVNGIRSTDFYGSWDFLQALVVQPDGKIVAAGEVKYTPMATPYNWYMSVGLARYHPDGQLDVSFGEGGKVHTEFYDEQGYVQSSSAKSVALQPDGGIVITGHTIIGNQYQNRNVILVRYLPDGGLDPRFGSDGRVSTDLGRADDFGNSVLVQADGKIVVAGDYAAIDAYDTISGNRDFLVLRYHSNGAADPTFGSAGRVITEFTSGYDTATSILQQADGKLIAAGGAWGGFGLARYLNPAPTAVTIDIRPGTDPNTVNLGSGGKVAVAILGGIEFDARTVDPETVTLASAVTALKGKGNLMASVDDVNADGYMDFVVHVDIEALYLTGVDTEATVEGRALNGTPFRGSDTVRVLP